MPAEACFVLRMKARSCSLRSAQASLVMLALLAASCARAQVACEPTASAFEERLEAALAARDGAAISDAVAAANPSRTAPTPERAERYQPLSEVRLTQHEVKLARMRFVSDAERLSWWRSETAPAPPDIPAPLRFPARLARAYLILSELDPENRERLISNATAAGDYLITASAEAQFAGAPFPYWRGREGRLGALSERVAQRLEGCGGLDAAVRRGWFVVETAPTEYYFDTGLGGEALALLYRKTGERRFLETALEWGQWADEQPLSSNWNYNAFIVGFFVELFYAADDIVWLRRALDRARFGVVSGMIQEGQDAGHFVDPHNERIVYRVIMARSLTQLSGALASVQHPALGEIESAAQLTITALEVQMRNNNGVSSGTGLSELYAAIERARRQGAKITSSDPDLRLRVLGRVAQAALRSEVAPDAGIADAFWLWAIL